MGKLGIGLDFGTSNTSVAVFDGNRINLLSIDPTNKEDYIMPTAIYFDREYNCRFGQEAIETYIENNMERKIRLTPYSLGNIEMTFGESDTFRGNRETGDTTVQVEVHALIDQEMEGQLFRYIKKALSSSNIDRINVFEKKFTVVAMLTIILREIRKRIEKITGRSIDTIHIGRPVNYSENSELNQNAIEQMKNACINAGFKNFDFIYEPIGAIYSYSRDVKIKGNSLVFDFGGGTLDISITTQDGKIMAVNGVPIGGSDFDRTIYQKKLFGVLGGKNIIFRNALGTKSKFCFNKFEYDLLNWMHTYMLNTQANLEHIRIALQNLVEGDPNDLKRLYTMITGNYSYLAYKGIEDAKCRLSEVKKTKILITPVAIKETITRSEFNSFIENPLREIEDCLKLTMNDAGIKAEEIDVVISTGGSSHIPMVKNMLDQFFPGKVVEYDTFTSVAAGLAIADFHRKEGL